MWKLIVIVALGLAAAGCRQHAVPSLEEKILSAYGQDAWSRQPAMGLDLHVETVGQANFDARITEEVHSNRVRMQLADDTIVVFDGRDVWISPPTAKVADARRMALNWPYLTTLPLRIKDPGVQLSPVQTRTLAGQSYASIEVRFGPGALENANDHYTLYAEPDTGRVRGIVVWPKGEDARPYALTCYDFRGEEGVTLSTEWRIWNYNATEGLYGKPVAGARIYNLELLVPRKDAFVAPPGARKE